MRLQDYDATKHDLDGWHGALVTVRDWNQENLDGEWSFSAKLLFHDDAGLYLERLRRRVGWCFEFYPWSVIQRIECISIDPHWSEHVKKKKGEEKKKWEGK